ncbi:MAG: hypothetical protein WBF17_05300 [Phycisphaerae bacterium]
MVNRNTRARTHPRRVAIRLILPVLMTALSAERASARPPKAAPGVTEIRFGTIEPPVVAQRDITVRAPTSNQQPEAKPLECSGLAWLDGHLVITSDRHGHLLFTCPVDMKAMSIGQPSPHVVILNEQELLDDAECIALWRQAGGGTVAYVMCSLSNDNRELPLPKRRHLLSVEIEQVAPFRAGHRAVLNAGTLRDALGEHFEAAGVRPYRTYYGESAGRDKNTYRWGNVEGITFTPDGSSLLCGMRNPLLDGDAMLFVVRGLREAFGAGDPRRLKVADLFTLDLGERGVSDLCWDPRTKGYLITAAKSNGPKLDKDQPFPPNTLDSALFWWSGRKTERPILFAKVPDMKIEAVCRLGSSRFIAIGSDEGDVSEGREQRQTVVTILDFTGIRGRASGSPHDR